MSCILAWTSFSDCLTAWFSTLLTTLSISSSSSSNLFWFIPLFEKEHSLKIRKSLCMCFLCKNGYSSLAFSSSSSLCLRGFSVKLRKTRYSYSRVIYRERRSIFFRACLTTLSSFMSGPLSNMVQPRNGRQPSRWIRFVLASIVLFKVLSESCSMKNLSHFPVLKATFKRLVLGQLIV